MAPPTITAIDGLQSYQVSVGGAINTADTLTLINHEIGFWDYDGIKSVASGDGLALVNLAAETAALSLATQSLVFHNATKDATFSNAGVSIAGGTFDISIGDLSLDC